MCSQPLSEARLRIFAEYGSAHCLIEAIFFLCHFLSDLNVDACRLVLISSLCVGTFM